MAKPSDLSSKPIATRVPMNEYLRMLDEASQMQMSISDYLLLKLYQSEQLPLLKQELQICRKELEAKEALLLALQKEMTESKA
jgi:hypothetical protein